MVRSASVMTSTIANILHRDTIAAIVGERTYERGRRCFQAKRVVRVEIDAGQIRGSVRPATAGRADYDVRVWIREDGLAYHCTCPVGDDGKFCKHAVAIALAHLDASEHAAEAHLLDIERTLRALPQSVLVTRLVAEARSSAAMHEALARMTR